MKQIVTILCLSLSGFIVLDTFNAGHAFTMFLFAGIIPGTNIALDANRMFEIFSFLIGFTLSRIIVSVLHNYGIARKLTAPTQSSKGTILSAHS